MNRISYRLKDPFAVALWLNGAMIICTISLFGVPVLAPAIADDLGVSTTLVGPYIALTWTASVLTSVLAGALLRRFGAMGVTQLCLLLCAAGMLFGSTGLVVMLFVAAIAVGLAFGVETPSSSYLLARITPAKQQPFIFSIKQSGAQIGGTAMLGPDPTGHREAGRCRDEFAGQPAYEIGGEAGVVGDPLRRIGREPSAECIGIFRGAGALGENHRGHAEREGDFGAREDGMPFVGVHPGQVHPGPYVDVPGHALSIPSVGLSKAALLLDDRPPGLQEIGTEGDDVAGPGEVVERHLVEPENAPIGDPLGGAVEGLVADQLAPDRLDEGGEEGVEAAGAGAADDHETARPFLNALSQAVDPFIPGNLFEGTALPGAGAPDPIGIVEPLKRRLSALAKGSRIDGMGGVSFELDGAGLAGLDVHPAAGAALGTGGCIPGRDARDLIFRLDEIRDEFLDALEGAARKRRRPGGGDANDFEEAAAVYRVLRL